MLTVDGLKRSGATSWIVDVVPVPPAQAAAADGRGLLDGFVGWVDDARGATGVVVALAMAVVAGAVAAAVLTAPVADGEAPEGADAPVVAVLAPPGVSDGLGGAPVSAWVPPPLQAASAAVVSATARLAERDGITPCTGEIAGRFTSEVDQCLQNRTRHLRCPTRQPEFRPQSFGRTGTTGRASHPCLR